MTAPRPGRPHVLERPACTAAAIRAVLAANAGPEILQRYDAELDAAFEQARRDEDLTVLVRTVRRWWFEADAWRHPDAQRAFLAGMGRHAADGPLGRSTASPARRSAPGTAPDLVPMGTGGPRRGPARRPSSAGQWLGD